MRWLGGLFCLLFAASAQTAPAAGVASLDAADRPLKEIESAGDAFARAAPLPSWADLATPPPAPPEASRRPVVVRLFETQLRVGLPPIQLTNRAVQVNDASELAQIGQFALEFNPYFERLLLHKVLILRGGQTIDHTRTALVRFLQREAMLERGLYSGVITASIVLPGVRAGDTLQLVYSIAGENPALLARYAQQVPWELPYPVVLRSVTLVAPVERQIHWRWFGGAGGEGPRPTETVVAGVSRLRFEARNLSGAEIEQLIPPNVQPMRWLQFSEYANWNEVARWALALFPADAPLPDDIGPSIARLRALADPEERTSQALHWVQTEIRNWSEAVGERAMRPQLPAVVLRRGYGDCKDKALLLASMLHALEIDARPALASLTTRNGPASMLPAPEVFDHVIVQARIAGREYYLDPARHGQAGLLSRMGQRFEGATVLPVDAGTHDLVVVRSPNRAEIFRSQIHERLSLESFDAEGRLEVEIQWFGLNAENVRRLLQPMDAAELRHFVSTPYSQQYAGSRLVSQPQVSDDRRLNQLKVNVSFAVPGLARGVGGYWAVPFAPGLGDAIVLPPRLTRRFPLAVPSFPVTYCYQVEMTWPDGVTIAETPASQRLETPHFRLLTSRSVRGNTESRSIEFVTKASEVPPAEVATFANDLTRMVYQIGNVMLAARSDTQKPAANSSGQDRPEGDCQPAVEPR